jgi:hypothetical protein
LDNEKKLGLRVDLLEKYIENLCNSLLNFPETTTLFQVANDIIADLDKIRKTEIWPEKLQEAYFFWQQGIELEDISDHLKIPNWDFQSIIKENNAEDYFIRKDNEDEVKTNKRECDICGFGTLELHNLVYSQRDSSSRVNKIIHKETCNNCKKAIDFWDNVMREGYDKKSKQRTEKIESTEIIKSLGESNQSLRETSLSYLRMVLKQYDDISDCLETRLSAVQWEKEQYKEKNGVNCDSDIPNICCRFLNDQIAWIKDKIKDYKSKSEVINRKEELK